MIYKDFHYERLDLKKSKSILNKIISESTKYKNYSSDKLDLNPEAAPATGHILDALGVNVNEGKYKLLVVLFTVSCCTGFTPLDKGCIG